MMVSFSNGGLSNDVSNKRPLENGFVPKYKPRRISAIRNFPPGCGPDAVPPNMKSEENGGNETEAAVADTLKSSRIANLIDPRADNNSEMHIKKENDEVNTSETPNVAGRGDVENSDIKAECESGEGVNINVDVDMTESLDALVGYITASANVDRNSLVESGPLGTQFPSEIEYQSDEGISNPIKVERAEPLEVLVGKVKTTTNGGEGREMSKELTVADRCDDVALLSSSTKASIRPKDKYRTRRVTAVRDFPPNCGRNISVQSDMIDDTRVGKKPNALNEDTRGNMEIVVHVPIAKAEGTVDNSENDSEKVRVRKFTDRENGSLILKKPRDYGVDDENMPTPISTIKDVLDDGDSDIGKDIVVYSQGRRDEKKPSRNVSGLMSARRKGKAVSTEPDAKTSGEKSKGPNSSWRKRAKVVAKKSCPKRNVKLSRFSSSSSKKKIKTKARIGDADEEDEGCGGDFPTDRESRDVEVTLPPFGPNKSGHGDARDQVRNTLRLFNAICRKLLQKEEANPTPVREKKSDKNKKKNRIDLFAAKIIKEKGKEVNTGKPILGEVPGVIVGDEFQYRVELAVVGIHRLYQAGIDSIKLDNGFLLATSIVSSGAYSDDLENNDVLIYSGQGGNVVGKKKQQPQDQKLEKGNLALKNSIDRQTPVRVIRGWKEKSADPLDPKSKLVTTYVYDGLYTVTKYWTDIGPRPHCKKVFMFELRRNPGQPELAWKELKKSNKARKRPGVCVLDISGGKEPVAICAVNTINDERPPSFDYVSRMMYPDWRNPVPPPGCDCAGRCTDSKRCRCASRNGGEIPYNRNGALVETKLMVYECGPHCKCPPSCYNRVSQRGIRYQLEIFKTESRGWGVRALTSIPSGSFICEYAGELLEDTEAERRVGNDEYLFDIGQNLSDSSQNPQDQAISAELAEDGGYTIDACRYGNIGRFINHSCSPNLYAQNVIYDHDDMRMSHIMLFAMENIPPLQELTYHYNYSVDQIRDSSGNIKVKKCYCGTAECTGRMY